LQRFSMQDRSPVRLAPKAPDPMLGTTPLNASNKDYVFSSAAQFFGERMAAFGVCMDTGEARKHLEEFCFRIWPQMPGVLRNQPGANRFGGLLALWMVAAALRPQTVVESGVFIGASVYVWRRALPEARILGFDLNLQHLKFRPEDVTFIENDWSFVSQDETPVPRLVFFDDHIDCVQRLKEAYARGFDYVLFDDTPDMSTLYKYRYPALPSVPMIMDDLLPDGIEFSWHHSGTNANLRYVFDKAYAMQARPLIAGALDLNMLYTHVGVDAGQKWLVKLQPNPERTAAGTV
jgi:hypothetical protein